MCITTLYIGIKYDHDEFKDERFQSEQRAKYSGLDIMDEYPKLKRHIKKRGKWIFNQPKQIEHRPPKKPQPSSNPLEGKNPQDGEARHHGTAVASMAGGNTLGVARDATLYSIRVIDGSGARVYEFHAIKALDHAVTKIKAEGRRGVINMSFRVDKKDILGEQSQVDKQEAFERAITKAVDNNIPMVAAAGNKNKNACDYNPGSYSDVITVGGTDKDNKKWFFSNFGNCIDIFAPGEGLTIAGTDTSSTYLHPRGGTSYAAPLVSGAVAMLLEENGQLTPDEIRKKLLDMSQDGVLTLPAYFRPRSRPPNKLLYVRGM